MSAGPILPMPGPTLLIADATALIEVKKSTPSAVIVIEPMVNMNKYKNMKANKLYVIWLDIVSLLSKTGITALGWILLLNSSNPFLINRTILTILIPPLVLPAEAPEKRNKKNINVKNAPHVV